MIVASMSTIPERKEHFKGLVKRILSEQTLPVDKLFVCLHRYGSINPDLPSDPRIEYSLSKPNQGPWVRYAVAEKLADDDVLATLDDDTNYPTNYFKKGVSDLQRVGNNAVVCYGGLRWNPLIDSFAYSGPERTLVLGYSKLQRDFRVSFLQGICSFMRARDAKGAIDLILPGFNTNDDMMISYHLQRTGRTIYCCVKDAGWITATEDAVAPHALFMRDGDTRQETFRRMVYELGFDPTAGWMEELTRVQRHIVVLAREIPLLSNDPSLHESVIRLCAEDRLVHVVAPVKSSQLAEVERFADLPYLVHPSAVPEGGRRFDALTLIRKSRARNLDTLSHKTWDRRLNAILTKLPHAQIVDWRDGKP